MEAGRSDVWACAMSGHVHEPRLNMQQTPIYRGDTLIGQSTRLLEPWWVCVVCGEGCEAPVPAAASCKA